MDTLTHIVLGACIGEAIAGNQLGKKALLLGALAQNIPDIDIVASFWLPTTADLLAHRGFTHSILFALLLSPLLAWFSVRVSLASGMSLRRWLFFWGLQVFIHIFIDAFNVYGTGWFEPFSHYRVSFNTLFVADPLLSIWPLIALLVLLVIRKNNPKRKLLALLALSLSSVYLLMSITFKLIIDNRVAQNLRNNKATYSRFFTTPTPLNILLWYIVVQKGSGYSTGYSSILDSKREINYYYSPRNESLLSMPCDTTDRNNLLRFSQGYYTTELRHDSLVFNDLRFGEILGWEQEHPQPVFYYYLQYPGSNKLIVQRGRFAGWDKAAIKRFIWRIGGGQIN